MSLTLFHSGAPMVEPRACAPPEPAMDPGRLGYPSIHPEGPSGVRAITVPPGRWLCHGSPIGIFKKCAENLRKRVPAPGERLGKFLYGGMYIIIWEILNYFS